MLLTQILLQNNSNSKGCHFESFSRILLVHELNGKNWKNQFSCKMSTLIGEDLKKAFGISKAFMGNSARKIQKWRRFKAPLLCVLYLTHLYSDLQNYELDCLGSFNSIKMVAVKFLIVNSYVV